MSDDPYQSRNEGQFGMPLSPGGDFNEWAIGRSIADQNRRELERQNEVSAQAYAPTAGSMPMPTPSFPGNAGTGDGGGGAAVTGSPAAAVGGCLALIVAVPLYSLTLPLWICAYPAAAVAAGAAGTAVISIMGNGDATITPLGRLMAGGSSRSSWAGGRRSPTAGWVAASSRIGWCDTCCGSLLPQGHEIERDTHAHQHSRRPGHLEKGKWFVELLGSGNE